MIEKRKRGRPPNALRQGARLSGDHQSRGGEPARSGTPDLGDLESATHRQREAYLARRKAECVRSDGADLLSRDLTPLESAVLLCVFASQESVNDAIDSLERDGRIVRDSTNLKRYILNPNLTWMLRAENGELSVIGSI